MKTQLRPLSTAWAAAMFGAALVCAGAAATAAETDVVRIMEKNASVFKVVGSESTASFVLTNKAGQERLRKTTSSTKLQANGTDNMRVTRFLAPVDVKGTVSLMIENAAADDSLWVYLPALKKVRRLASSNMKDSFVGTDFSNADVIGYKVTEWSYTLLREESVDAEPCYVIQAIPKNATVRSNTGYSKRVQWVRKDNLMTVKSELWDEGGEPLKTTSYHDIQLVDAAQGKWQAMRLEANNLQTGHRTSIRIESFKLSHDVSNDVFTPRYLERE